MTKTFTLDGVEYTVTPCSAIPGVHQFLGHGAVAALLIENTADSGEKFQKVCFGYDMPNTIEDFTEMCEDSSAWESDHEVLATVMTGTTANRQIVQEGLDRRAEARAEATQEALDDLFLDDLNKLTQASRDMTAALEATQERVRAQKREKRQEEADATRRDTFMNRIFTALCIIAAVIWLYTIEAVAFWLALTIGIAGLLYIIVKSVGYYTRDKRKEK